jgi:hypothetical protein
MTGTAPHLADSRASRPGMILVLGVLVLLMLVAAAAASAAPRHRAIFDPAATPSWWHAYHGVGASSDKASDVVIAKSGSAYVCGELGNAAGNIDASLVKLVGGEPTWPAPKTYDSPFHGFDSASRAAIGPGGTVYTAGASEAANGKRDVLVIKWSAAGAVQWARRYDGPAHGNDAAEALGVDSAGNVTVAAVSESSGAGLDWAVVSWSASGSKRWTWRYDNPAHGNDLANDLVVAKDGSVYVTGYSEIGMSGASSLTVRLSASGSKKWQKSYAGPEGIFAIALAAAARPGGGVYVCGMTASAATGTDGLVVSYTPSGARAVLALDTGPGGATAQLFRDLAVTSTKQVVAVGASATGMNSDCHVATYTKDGTIAGKLTLPGAWDDSFAAVAADGFGGYAIAGEYHTAVNKTAIFTTRGSVLTGGGGWLSLWAPAFVSESNDPSAIAVKDSTAIVVGRCQTGAAQGIDQVMLGYVY